MRINVTTHTPRFNEAHTTPQYNHFEEFYSRYYECAKNKNKNTYRCRKACISIISMYYQSLSI